MSRRDELLEELLILAGPLGPFTTPEERLAHERPFMAALDSTALDDLLGIFVAPAPPQLHVVHRPWFEDLLVLSIAAAGRDCPDRVLEAVIPLLDDPALRLPALDVLGSVGREEAVAPLDRLLRQQILTDDGLERLACSLGEIGGPAALSVLTWMRTQTLAPSVVTEIDIAIEAIARRGE